MRILKENHSEGSQKNPRQSEGEDTLKDPTSERKTDQDPSHQLEEHQSADKTEQAQAETDDQIFSKLSKIADSVNPVTDEDHWKKKREANLYLRLNIAAQKLKEWQKTDDQKNPKENPQAAGSDTISKKDSNCQDQATQFLTGDKDISAQELLIKP